MCVVNVNRRLCMLYHASLRQVQSSLISQLLYCLYSQLYRKSPVVTNYRFFDMKLWSFMIAVNVQSVLHSNELICYQLWQLHVKHFCDIFGINISDIDNEFYNGSFYVFIMWVLATGYIQICGFFHTFWNILSLFCVVHYC